MSLFFRIHRNEQQRQQKNNWHCGSICSDTQPSLSLTFCPTEKVDEFETMIEWKDVTVKDFSELKDFMQFLEENEGSDSYVGSLVSQPDISVVEDSTLESTLNCGLKRNLTSSPHYKQY